MPSFIEIATSQLRYEPDTGQFIWLVRKNSRGGTVAPGKVAGTPKDGYVQIKIEGQQWRAHRLAWLLMTGSLPDKGREIDHVNGDRSDNRWVNLREATRSQNATNSGLSKKNKSGVRGISWIKRDSKWDARIRVNGTLHLIGRFAEKEDAIRARKDAERRLCGEFVRAA